MMMLMILSKLIKWCWRTARHCDDDDDENHDAGDVGDVGDVDDVGRPQDIIISSISW